MSRISSSTTNQTSTVSSTVLATEQPVVSQGSETASVQQADTHSEAQRQNALDRQKENDLSAALQREKLADVVRPHIAKEDMEALSIALNSNGPAAEGVKEELDRTFVNNGPGQHAKIAECLRQFATAGTDSYAKAYHSLKQGVKDWVHFDGTGQLQPAQRNFFKEVANLKGPGSERVKADVAAMLQNTIETAKRQSDGMDGFAGMYTAELGKLLRSDAPGIFKTMENDLQLSKEIPGMVDNLLNHKEGQNAIGGMVVDMASATAKTMMKAPRENGLALQRLGMFMGRVEHGIERNAKTREQMIEKGANILGFGLKAAEKLSPGEAKPAFEKVYEGLDWLKGRNLASVEETKSKLRSTIYELADNTFKTVADPYGNLAAGYGEDPKKVENYQIMKQMFNSEYMEMREDALTRESLR